MPRLDKQSLLFSSNHFKLRFFCLSSSSIPVAQEKPELPFSRSLDPKLALSSLILSKTLVQVKQIHAQVVTNGLSQNLVVANKLLYLYCQFRELGFGYKVFSSIGERNPVTWSVMIGGFSKVGDFSKLFAVFRELVQSGHRPDNYTLPFVIRVCRDMVDGLSGKVVHSIVLKHGFESNRFVGSSLVDMYARCREIDDARKLFDEMPSRDVVTWTVMIGGYAECGDPCKSLELFDLMRTERITPDKFVMVSLVSACAKLGAMNKAKLVRDYIEKNKFSLDVVLGTAMIDMYSKCGSLDSATEVFAGMNEKNVISWSTMIAAYGHHGQGREALGVFDMMMSSGTLPNAITFVSLLYACSHSGLVEDGIKFFESMWKEHGVRPDVKHYTCVVDLLGRAGRLDEATELLEGMEIEKDEGLWCAFLGACKVHGQRELIEKAADSLLEFQSHNPGHYVLLSNIYAKSGRWKDVARVRDRMTKAGVKKVPGLTWIEVGDDIHQFNSGDESHPRSEEIHEMLESLIERLKLSGYVPDTSFVSQDVDEEVKARMLYGHSEKLAIAFGLVASDHGTPIRIAKNLRVCGDCHTFTKLVSAITQRFIVVRDANRFHHFKEGVCSCGDYW